MKALWITAGIGIALYVEFRLKLFERWERWRFNRDIDRIFPPDEAAMLKASLPKGESPQVVIAARNKSLTR